MDYTKGDWKVTTHSPLSNLVVVVRHGEHAYDDDTICLVTTCPEEKANAQLISSAPDMFQALVEMESYLVNRQPENTYQLEIARKALAKAEAA